MNTRSLLSTTLGDAKINTHLTKYDTVHGRFNAQVEEGENALFVNGDESKLSLSVILLTCLGLTWVWT